MSNSGETWYVKLPNGDVHPVTIDQLDWAFEQGHIDANTLVLSEEAEGWARLGDVAGLDEASPAAAAPATAPVSMAAPVHVAAPVSVAAPVRVVAPTPVAAPVYAPSPTPMAVAYSAAPRPTSYAPVRAPAPNSLRPVSLDVDDFDLNDVPFKARSRKGWVVAVVGIAIMGGGVGLASQRLHGDATPVPQAAAVQAPPPVETHVPYQTPAPVVAAAPPPPGDSPLNPRFSEAQKEQLLKADKKRDEKAAAKSHASSGSTGHSAKYKSMGFTTGGNKFDPMNSSL
ncbi:MAG: GYF domain-containing protein [Polyangiaceae bacterium]|jgi:hypothetical protein